MKAKWIWFFGDFENYHRLILSNRRQEHTCDYPSFCHISPVDKVISFISKVNLKEPENLHVYTFGKGYLQAQEKLYPVNKDITIPAGEYQIEIVVSDVEAFPAIFIDSENIKTHETWTADAMNRRWTPVGCKPEYLSKNDDPRVFPFLYETLKPVSVEKINGGLLYDYSKETFGIVTIEERQNPDGIFLSYGESKEEALDVNDAIIREKLEASDCLKRPSRAFRYIFAKADDGSDVKLKAEYEYLPLQDKSSFECENELIKKIWDTCSYTFHLNSREFFLDGIKRDRWVWSGDAYQSFMINRLLFNDDEITERTIVSLLGKPPYKSHINFINDYSAYLIISVYDHYFATGNKEFVSNIYENLKELFKFIVSRLDKEGLSCKMPGDWVFIDWGVLDKDGPHCVEQILLWKVYIVMTELSKIMGENDDYLQKAENIKKIINERYWNKEKGAFIDTFTSGKNFVSRQTNVFAILYDFATPLQKESIIKNVFKNPEHPEITTPYFKLYELLAMCKCSMIEDAQDYIESYWGGMLSLGATSVWEAFDPTQTGAEHYEMYGNKYGKSLCHAWGSGPILLLIGHCIGLYPTSVGSKTFSIKPQPGKYKAFKATAPIRDGLIEIEYKDNKFTVSSTVDGGTFIWKDKKYEIKPNETLTVE